MRKLKRERKRERDRDRTRSVARDRDSFFGNCSSCDRLFGRVSGSICQVECHPLCGSERGRDLFFPGSIGVGRSRGRDSFFNCRKIKQNLYFDPSVALLKCGNANRTRLVYTIDRSERDLDVLVLSVAREVGTRFSCD